MEKLLFTLLLLGSGAGVGLASVVGWMQLRLSKTDTARVREHLANAVTKLGIAITQGVLTWRLAESAETGVPVTWSAYAYTIGLAVVTSGLALQVRDVIVDLSRAEAGVTIAKNFAAEREQVHRDEATKEVAAQEAELGPS